MFILLCQLNHVIPVLHKYKYISIRTPWNSIREKWYTNYWKQFTTVYPRCRITHDDFWRSSDVIVINVKHFTKFAINQPWLRFIFQAVKGHWLIRFMKRLNFYHFQLTRLNIQHKITTHLRCFIILWFNNIFHQFLSFLQYGTFIELGWYSIY